jgi:hypothetical protein
LRASQNATLWSEGSNGRASSSKREAVGATSRLVRFQGKSVIENNPSVFLRLFSPSQMKTGPRQIYSIAAAIKGNKSKTVPFTFSEELHHEAYAKRYSPA